MNPSSSFRFRASSSSGRSRPASSIVTCRRRVIEQTKDVKQRAFAAAGRTDDRMDGARFEIERDSAQRVHA